MHESLRLYAICKGMQWTHLPQAGGLYDQHPQLLDDFLLIMSTESIIERRKHEAEMNKNKSKQSGLGGRSRTKRGRR